MAGAIGAVVMNAPVSWYDDFEIVDAEDKDDYVVCFSENRTL